MSMALERHYLMVSLVMRAAQAFLIVWVLLVAERGWPISLSVVHNQGPPSLPL
jgi:hypothetical protein